MTEVIGSAAQMGEDPRASVASLSADQLSKVIEDALARFVTPQFTKMAESLEQVSRRVDQVSRQMDDLDTRVERQEMRLASIESFPWPPMVRPATRHATELHSATMPQRVRAGYSG